MMENVNDLGFDLPVAGKNPSLPGLRFFLLFSVLLLLPTVNVLTQGLNAAKKEIIAKGNNQKAVEGDGFRLLSYRIEKIPLLDSKSAVAIRLVLTGQFDDSNYTIWINGAGHPAYLTDSANLDLIMIGSEVKFEANSEIAVSSGVDLHDARVSLPEPFIIPSYLEKKPRSRSELKSSVRLSYIGCNGALLDQDKPCIRISINNPASENAMAVNHGWYLQIGTQEFGGDGNNFTVSMKEFEELKDDDWVVIKTVRGALGGAMVGILDKSSLRK